MTSAAPWLLIPDALMAGVILSVQLLVYPGLSYYSRADLARWHSVYTARISLLVVPLMLIQLLGGSYWVYSHPGKASGIYIALVVLLWGITFIRFVPLHTQISRGLADHGLLRKLVNENWIRTFLWLLLFIVHLIFWWRAQ